MAFVVKKKKKHEISFVNISERFRNTEWNY